jgi:general stress protein 26
MATFSVILENITTNEVRGQRVLGFINKRVATIDARDIDDAWQQARHTYYNQQVDGPDAQIVDIKAGAITLQTEPKPEEAEKH